jgi:DNA-binding MarR family transcriptional regulator
MLDLVKQLNKTFENRIKLGIMSHLMVEEKADYMTLKNMFELTDGNLASHVNSLEREGYVAVKKKFIDKRPNTSYQITAKGRKAFNEHLDAMEKMLKKRV